jgi:hypothetical protein
MIAPASPHGPQVGAPPSLEQVPIDRLHVDPTYQRATDSAGSRLIIAGMVKEWDWSLCQPLVVSRRADSSLWILDGQHRHAGATRRGDIPYLPCVILASLDHQAEARAFVGLNTRRQKLSQGQIFHGQLAAGDPDAKAIQDMLDQTGWRVMRHSNTAAFKAGELECAPMLVRALQQRGADTIRFALTVLRAAYPETAVRSTASMLKALFEIFDYHDPAGQPLSATALIKALAAVDQAEWVTRGHMVRDSRPHLSYIDALALAIRLAGQGKPLPVKTATEPAIKLPPRPAADKAAVVQPAPARAPEPATAPTFGSSGKGWCNQCEQLRTRESAARCLDPFCKLRSASN